MGEDGVVAEEAEVIVGGGVRRKRGIESCVAGNVSQRTQLRLLTHAHRANSTSAGFSARCVCSRRCSSLFSISPSPCISSSEQEMAKRGVRMGWTSEVGPVRRLDETADEGREGESQCCRTKLT